MTISVLESDKGRLGSPQPNTYVSSRMMEGWRDGREGATLMRKHVIYLDGLALSFCFFPFVI